MTMSGKRQVALTWSTGATAPWLARLQTGAAYSGHWIYGYVNAVEGIVHVNARWYPDSNAQSVQLEVVRDGRNWIRCILSDRKQPYTRAYLITLARRFSRELAGRGWPVIRKVEKS